MKNSIELTQAQREELEQLLKKGSASVQKIKHAQVLLKSDTSQEGPKWSDDRIQEAFGVSSPTIWRTRKRFLEHGMDAALNRYRQPARPEKQKITGEKEARIIALACSEPPLGYARWTIRLLTKRVIELEIVEDIGRESIRLVLKKMNSNRS